MSENDFMYDKTLFDRHTEFNPSCVRKKSNFSIPSHLNLIDSKSGEIEYFREHIEKISPKLTTLFQTIEKLDKDDMRIHGKLFKHFIFTDIRSSLYGAKIIGSGFIEKGYRLGYTAQRKNTNSNADANADSKSKKEYGKIQLFTEATLNQTPNKNFYILSSSGLFDQPIGRELKKNILKNFNERPGNVYGKNVRFIIMDSGYKEGIDLFDIKYIHIFEPQTTMADLKQVIGRGTRLCGQKGLDFHPRRGWELDVYVYDLNIEKNIQPLFLNSKSAFDLYLKSLNYDVSLFNFQSSLEEVVIEGAVDYELNKNINKHVPEEITEEVTLDVATGGANTPLLNEGENEDEEEGDVYIQPSKARKTKKNRMVIDDESEDDEEEDKVKIAPKKRRKYKLIIEDDEEAEDYSDKSNGKKMNFEQMRDYIRSHFKRFTWDKIKVQNDCLEKGGNRENRGKKISLKNITKGKSHGQKGGLNPVLIDYTPTQNFVRHFFTPQLYNRGILLWHSVGTGKTCSAIATATSTFEQQGYTILWVTRTTLINDIWKNMFSLVCNESIRKKIKRENIAIPDELNKQVKLLSNSWKIHPISYKQFTNLVSKKNQFYKILEKLNGAEDPLKKTLIIIDEAHKLYGESDLLTNEKPNMEELHASLMNSYAVSGKDSVKLMLMTATPITKDPMELIKLLNLCKPIEQQLPVDFYAFKEKFLNQEGVFTEANKMRFLNDIAGYVSYLDRSNDIRQFAQPKLHYINTNLITDEDILTNDKRAVREINKVMKEETKNNNQLLKKEYESGRLQLKRIKKEFKEDMEKVFEPRLEAFGTKKMRSQANKTVKNRVKHNYQEMLDTYKERLADYKERLKQKLVLFGKHKDDKDDKESEGEGEDEEKDPNFKKNVFYNLRYKCGKSMHKPELMDYVNSNPEIAGMIDRVKALEANIEALEKKRDEEIKIQRSLMKRSKKEKDENQLKQNKQQIERIKESSKQALGKLTKELTTANKETKKNIKFLKKDLKSVIRDNVKTRKRELKEELKRQKEEQIEIREEYNEYTRELLDKTRDNVLRDVDRELDLLLEEEHDVVRKEEAKEQKKVEAKEQKKMEKERKNEEKTRKKIEKERTRQEIKTSNTRKKLDKQIEKQREKELKEREKQREKELKDREKQREKELKEREKQQLAQQKQREAERKKQEKASKTKTKKGGTRHKSGKHTLTRRRRHNK